MNIAKRFCLLMLCGLMTFSTVSMSYYQGVYAMEWVEGALTVAEALKWVLGMLGIITTAGAVGDEYFWGEREEEFIQFVDENYETVGPNVREWLEKLSKGVLDKGSEVWIAFKAWASSLTTDSSSNPDVNWSDGVYTGTVRDIFDNIGLSTDGLSDDILNRSISTSFAYYYFRSDGSLGNLRFFTNVSQSQISFTNSKTGQFNVSIAGPFSSSMDYSFSSTSNGYYSDISSMRNNVSLGLWSSDGHIYHVFGYDGSQDIDFSNFVTNWNLVGSSSVTDNDFVAVKKDVTDLDPISSVTGDDSSDAEVAIPMPGLSGSDDAESADAYDDIIAGYNDGTVSLPDTIKEIQEVTKVIVIDDTNDTVFPTPDGEEPVSKDDALQDIKDNMGFTITGLETVFPFCIPWDIYAFLSLLEAEPVAPSFQFPFRNPATKEDVMYTVDLSPFNDVAVVVRYGFDLIFIVGLAIASRKLIGAGGDS